MLLLLLLLHILAVVPSGGELVGTTLVDGIARNKTSESATVLVLGSGGLVGSALVTELRRRGYHVLEAKDRMHLDLRVDGSLAVFDERKISFCFFLACEVGGSKFISSGSNDEAIWQYNIAIYANVLPYLERRQIPFIFSSSQLAVTGTAYGKVKARGEELVSSSKYGKFLRFWNVFGAEKIGAKSHIVGDWIYQCVKYGQVASHTNGLEMRQFVHADDMAFGLVDLMLNFEKLPPRVDITSGQWVTMRQIASMIQQHSKHGCKFQFTDKNSSTMIGIEPENLWHVNSTFANLHTRVHQMFVYYEAVVLKEAHPRHHAPYLSFIMCSTNDNYNDIRGRTFNAITSLAANAEAAHLSYELIVVQYNPALSTDYWAENFFLKEPQSDRDLPLSQLFPWVSSSSFGNLRIITVPPSLHRWPDKGRVWEYIGKNVGAVRARGQFLVFTNPDDILPRGMIEQLAKQQLENHKLYRAGVINNFKQLVQVQDLMQACNNLSVAVIAPQPNNKGKCVRIAPSDLQSEQMQKIKYKELDGTPDLMYAMIGDFCIFPRDSFLNSSGYLEIPQNKHLETAHLFYISNGTGTTCQLMDHYVCHQQHDKDGRPAAPDDWKTVGELHLSRTDSSDFGLQLQDLPEANMQNILMSAYNPEQPFKLYQHHHLFFMFKKALWRGELDEAFVTDFLGVRTSYYFDCADSTRYRYFHLSRRIPCSRHEEFFRRKYNESGYEILGDLPVVDEEYFEWLSLLKAVSHQLPKTITKPFVVLEFGARYGTWAVRGGAAMRALQPLRPLQIMAVEADQTGFQWLQSHLQVNGLSSVTRIVNGFVTNTKTEVRFKAWERDSPDRTNVTSFTLQELLSEYTVIDIIHCDIQKSEIIFVDEMALITSKVKAIHFGTHSDSIHIRLKQAFSEAGWSIVQDIIGNNGKQPGRIEHTAFGPVRILWDGILAVENPKLL